MTIVLPALVAAFVAFCVWLTVRIVNRRERWAKWLAAGLVMVFIIYPLSIGPVCRINLQSGQDFICAPRIYWPLGWAITKSDSLKSAVGWYVGSMMPSRVVAVAVPFMPSGGQWLIWPSG